jgi:hypothetical protein
VATIGTGLSSGWRTLGITPDVLAGSTSQAEFSMNQAGRMKAVGMGSAPRDCSMMCN